MSDSTRKTSIVATAAAVVAAASIALPILGVAGIQLRVLAPMVGFTVFAAGAVLGGAIALVLGVVGLVLTRGGSDPDGRKRAFTGVGGGVALLGLVLLAGSPGAGLPPINDITTDLDDPPAFQGDPSGEEREMGYPSEWRGLARDAYPDLQPYGLEVTTDEAFDRALAAADALGWEITQRDPSAGRFEATDTTAIFRFVDDIVVRVRPEVGGAVIDIRSKSRDGRGDVGANAARIRAFTTQL